MQNLIINIIYYCVEFSSNIHRYILKPSNICLLIDMTSLLSDSVLEHTQLFKTHQATSQHRMGQYNSAEDTSAC